MADTHHDQQRAPPQAGSPEAAPPFWEWVAAGVGLLLVLASIGVLAYYAWTGQSDLPQPQVQVVAIEQQPAGWLVAVRVHNRATATAAALRLTGRLRQGSEVVEESRLELQYLPGGSSREGGFFFSRDPRLHSLEWSFESYEQP